MAESCYRYIDASYFNSSSMSCSCGMDQIS